MQLKTLRVLVVDDLEMNRVILTRQLDVHGVKVSAVNDGFSALAELERACHQGKPFDLVVLDQMMPGMSGETLAQRIRAMPGIAETKLLLVSSAGQISIDEKDTTALDAVLEKPVRERDLLEALHRLYSGGGARDMRPVSTSTDGASVNRGSASSRPLHILIAEDNEVNQEFARILLCKAGHEVEIVGNGREAVTAVRRSDYDVVLMDIQMPDLDGVQATVQIRALPPPKCSVPIIALTAHAMAGFKEEYLRAGMDDYVSKPITPEILLSKLANLALVTIRQKPNPHAATDASAAAPISTSPLTSAPSDALDLERLKIFEEMLQPDEVRDLLNMYLLNAGEIITKIRLLSESDDLAALATDAHTLIGTSGNVGATAVSALARALEASSKAGELNCVRRLVAELTDAAAVANDAIHAWLKERSPETLPGRRVEVMAQGHGAIAPS